MGAVHHNQQRAVLLHYKRWTKGKQLDLVGLYNWFRDFFFLNRKVYGFLLKWFPIAVCLCPSLSVIEAWAYLPIVVTGTTMGKSD